MSVWDVLYIVDFAAELVFFVSATVVCVLIVLESVERKRRRKP